LLKLSAPVWMKLTSFHAGTSMQGRLEASPLPKMQESQNDETRSKRNRKFYADKNMIDNLLFTSK
jgi:hypothetical protein